MNALTFIPVTSAHRQVNRSAKTSQAATNQQAARLAGLITTSRRPALFWDPHVVDRLTAPVSRIRE